MARLYRFLCAVVAFGNSFPSFIRRLAATMLKVLGSTNGFVTTVTMRKSHLIWVTARIHVEIYKYLAWSDVLEIETWCQSKGRIGSSIIGFSKIMLLVKSVEELPAGEPLATTKGNEGLKLLRTAIAKADL